MLIGNSKTEEKMKKIFIIAAAVLAFAGCAKEAAQEERVTNDGKEYMTFKVVAHDDVVLDDTKATLSRGGVFGWEDGEPIYFVAVGGTMATGSYNASAGTITVESGDWFCASTAPFDSDSKIKDFGLAKGPVVWAKVDGSTLHFYHIGSVINVKFDNIPIDGFLEFWPNGGKTWAGGNFHFYSSGDPELDDGGTDDIYIKKPITKADSGKDITLTVPNILYDYGFTVALSGTSARYFEKSTSNSFDLQALPTLLNMKQLSVPTYTVAGAIDYAEPPTPGIFGTAWDVSNTDNDMVLDADGLYRKKYSNIPDQLIFKVVEDHSWGASWPYGDGNNYIHSVSEEKKNGGATIIFNRGENSISVDDYVMYTVAGLESLCGVAWNPTATANDMTEISSGVFYKKFTGVLSSAGEADGVYQLKVTKNHSWAESWGAEYGGNFIFQTEGGDAEVYFYPAVPSIKVVCDYTPKYRIAGNSSVLFGTTWDPTNDANLMTDLGNGTYQISYNCTTDESGVAFKVTKDGAWSYEWPSSDYSVGDVKEGQTRTIFYNPTTCDGKVTVE